MTLGSFRFLVRLAARQADPTGHSRFRGSQSQRLKKSKSQGLPKTIREAGQRMYC